MTYCVGVMLDAGMVFASDSRTSAGVDHVSTFRKMKVFQKPDDRLIVVLSSGNLSITQHTLNLLERDGQGTDAVATIWNAKSMFDVATLIGEGVRKVRGHDGPYLEQANVDASANFIIGGQIKGERQRLFMVYSEGNFIEAGDLMPFFQIGETKYGRPILDRVITSGSSLIEAAKCTLVSFDSTMRSNVSVGLPIDMLTYRNNSLQAASPRRIEETDPYFSMIHTQWGEGLRRVFAELPDPQWNGS
jgi:putative proteasome-type protease